MEEQEFVGAKLALFVGQRLLITLRDDVPGIPYPGLWDFPGGGREDTETPEQTVLRELREEVGLSLSPDVLLWKRFYPARYLNDTAQVCFFVGHTSEKAASQVVFGDEGQGWGFVSLQGYMTMPHTVPSYPERLNDWLTATDGQPIFETNYTR